MNNKERVDNYHANGYPDSLFVSNSDNRIYGTWIMGQNYKVKSGYYGGYPHSYLKRVKSLFPDKANVLHLFSGKVNIGEFPGDTVDVNPDIKATYTVNAEDLSPVPIESYDLIIADPPYSIEDCDHYGTPMVSRNKVVKQLAERTKIGCHVVWLDQVLPMYTKKDLSIVGAIGMVKSTNHRFRMVTIFEKREV